MAPLSSENSPPATAGPARNHPHHSSSLEACHVRTRFERRYPSRQRTLAPPIRRLRVRRDASHPAQPCFSTMLKPDHRHEDGSPDGGTCCALGVGGRIGGQRTVQRTARGIAVIRAARQNREAKMHLREIADAYSIVTSCPNHWSSHVRDSQAHPANGQLGHFEA